MKKYMLLLTASIFSSLAYQVVAAPILYVPLGVTGEIQALDTSTDRVVGNIRELGNSHGIAITPDNNTIISGSYSVADPSTSGIPARPQAVPKEEHERHHRKSNNAQTSTSGVSFVSIVDVDTMKVARRIAVHGAVHHVAISPTDPIAVTTHPAEGGISVIDLKSFDVLTTLPTGSTPNYAVFTPDSKFVYVSNTGDNTISEIDTDNWTVVRKIKTGMAPEHILLSPDEEMLYVNNVGEGTVSAIYLGKWNIESNYQVGKNTHGIGLSDDQKILYVSNKTDRKLIAINLENDTRRELTLAPMPYHITAVKGTGKLYISSRAKTKLWVVDQYTLEILNTVKIGGVGHQMAVAYQ